VSAQDVQQILVSGISNGAIYGLIALGYAVGFSATRVINFALGDLLMAAVMLSVVIGAAGVPLSIAIVIGLACAAGIGGATYLGAVKPAIRRNPNGFSWLVTTLGVSIVLEAVAALLWQSQSRPYPPLLNETTFKIHGTTIPYQDLLEVGVIIVVVVALHLVRTRSLFGKAAVASAADPEMASAFGISQNVVAVTSFAIAGLLAGVAGILVAPLAFANPFMGVGFGLKGFVAMMVGGIGSVPGALVGAIILGLSEAFAINRFGTGAGEWFPFVLLIVVLIVRPRGILSGNQPAFVT
jgi:branched-chain amino acid transport system permease protein